MSERQETIADIIAEMRDEGHTGESSCLEWVGTKMRYYADRLEAAHRRERGDAAKLREALKATLGLFFDIHNANRSPQSNQAYAVIRKIKAALAAPPRNCDKYPTFNDAIRALADKRGWHDAKWDSERYCILAQWLYAPATEKEGGAK